MDMQGDESSDGRSGSKHASVNDVTGKRVTSTTKAREEPNLGATTAPCGACKFLRRKCVNGCVFAPYFASDQGQHGSLRCTRCSVLVMCPSCCYTYRRTGGTMRSLRSLMRRRRRLSDPVYGCVSTILALQHQVAALQNELSFVQTQLINSRLAVANALQNSQQQHTAVLQPAFSNNSSASNNLLNLSNFASGFDIAAADTAPSSRSFEPLQLSRPSQEEDGDEEESGNPLYLQTKSFTQNNYLN